MLLVFRFVFVLVETLLLLLVFVETLVFALVLFEVTVEVVVVVFVILESSAITIELTTATDRNIIKRSRKVCLISHLSLLSSGSDLHTP